jgi:hypothetical protein
MKTPYDIFVVGHGVTRMITDYKTIEEGHLSGESFMFRPDPLLLCSSMSKLQFHILTNQEGIVKMKKAEFINADVSHYAKRVYTLP